MPFTFSHPAIVLPFNCLSKRWFSLTALVAGSIVPDFEYFIRMKIASKYSHSWTGLLWFDLPLGLLLMLLYNKLVRNKMIDNLPPYFNKRFSSLKYSEVDHFKYYWIVVIISILLGGASHIIWDSFTHPGGYFTQHLAILKYPVEIARHRIPLYKILQHLSTLIGALVILFAISDLPIGNPTISENIIYYWMKVIALSLLVLIGRFLTGLKFHEYGDVIVTVISGMLIGLIVMSVITPEKKVAIN